MSAPTVRLRAFMRYHRIRAAELARRSGISVGRLYRLRYGLVEPDRLEMVQIARACSVILGKQVPLLALFDLGWDLV